MPSLFSRREALATLAAGAFGLTRAASARAASVGSVKIGLLKSMFRDIKPAMLPVVSKPLQTVILAQTGLHCDTVLVDTADELRQQLTDGDLQLGVFHGFEFAWMRLKQSNLTPLMLSIINPGLLQAVVVVPVEDEATSWGELKNKKLALSNGCREHTRLFLARSCGGRDFNCLCELLPGIEHVANGEEALEAVIKGSSGMAIVELATWLAYQEIKPGRSKRLKSVQQSVQFPYSTIAHCRGSLDAATLTRFRNGMATAHQSPLGKQLMRMMKMSGFEPVPANYEQQLAEIVAAYPPA